MYAYDIDPQSRFTDRTRQFAGLGLPLADIRAVRERTIDMWADGPGGWSYQCSKLAESYTTAGDHQLAADAYGRAHFPCLNTEATFTVRHPDFSRPPAHRRPPITRRRTLRHVPNPPGRRLNQQLATRPVRLHHLIFEGVVTMSRRACMADAP